MATFVAGFCVSSSSSVGASGASNFLSPIQRVSDSLLASENRFDFSRFSNSPAAEAAAATLATTRPQVQRAESRVSSRPPEVAASGTLARDDDHHHHYHPF